MDKETAIKCRNLSFRYPDGNPALDNISIDIFKGEKIALIGPNGAGKSTLLLQFNGILRGKGEIVINDHPLNSKNIPLIRRGVGVVFQDPNDQLFCPEVFDDVAFGPMHFGIPKNEIPNLVKESLKQVGLDGFQKKSSHHLSLGERKRVAIATVLSCRPEIILMDEPTANLDPKHRSEMIEMINDWNYTSLIATHDLDLAWDTCTKCIIINRGKIKIFGDTKEILKDEKLLKENDLELPLKFQ